VEDPVEGPGPLADERCGRVVLDFLSTMDVGRRVPAEEDAVSEVSEAELREWERSRERGPRSRAMGSCSCSFPRLTSGRPQERARRFHLSFPFVFPFLSLCHFLDARHTSLGQAWAEGKGELATCPRADRERETLIKSAPP